MKKQGGFDTAGSSYFGKMACGPFHSMVAGREDPTTENKKPAQLFVWGQNLMNVLALSSFTESTFFENDRSLADAIVDTPVVVPNFEKWEVVQVACGHHHSMVIAKLKNQNNFQVLWAFGMLARGRLGCKEFSDAEKANLGNFSYGRPICLVHHFEKTVSKNPVSILTVSCGPDYTLAVTDEHRLYAWGGNSHGQLGLAKPGDVWTPRWVETLGDVEVVSVSAGTKHALCVTSEGAAYSWGHGGNGRLGLGNDVSAFAPRHILPSTFQTVAEAEDIRVDQVSAGEAHSAAIDQSGRLFTWGNGELGRLGHGEAGDCLTPREVTSLTNLTKQVACGVFHTLAVSAKGRVFGWGMGPATGVLMGPPDGEVVPVPQQVPGLDKVVEVAVGPFHSLAAQGGTTVEEQGKLWGWGRNLHKQLGLEEEGEQDRGSFTVYQPQEIKKVKVGENAASLKAKSLEDVPVAKQVSLPWSVIKVACGGAHTLALCDSEDGKIFAWGRGDEGQLGLGKRWVSEPCPSPRLLDHIHGGAIDVAAGEDNSAYISPAGVLYTWGRDEHGKLGRGSFHPNCVAVPRRVGGWVSLRGRLIDSVVLARSHTLAIDRDGKAWAWGSGLHGRLGTGTQNDESEPQLVKLDSDTKITQVAAAAFHSCFITSDHKLLVCGKAESLCMMEDIMEPTDFTELVQTERLPSLWTCVAAGDEFTVAVPLLRARRKAAAYCWGDNRKDQLGVGFQAVKWVQIPKPMAVDDSFPPISRVACGFAHCICLVGGDESLDLEQPSPVFAWGSMASGRLGVDEDLQSDIRKRHKSSYPCPIFVSPEWDEKRKRSLIERKTKIVDSGERLSLDSLSPRSRTEMKTTARGAVEEEEEPKKQMDAACACFWTLQRQLAFEKTQTSHSMANLERQFQDVAKKATQQMRDTLRLHAEADKLRKMHPAFRRSLHIFEEVFAVLRQQPFYFHALLSQAVKERAEENEKEADKKTEVMQAPALILRLIRTVFHTVYATFPVPYPEWERKRMDDRTGGGDSSDILWRFNFQHDRKQPPKDNPWQKSDWTCMNLHVALLTHMARTEILEFVERAIAREEAQAGGEEGKGDAKRRVVPLFDKNHSAFFAAFRQFALAPVHMHEWLELLKIHETKTGTGEQGGGRQDASILRALKENTSPPFKLRSS
eukprot:Cvel_23744.t1-p1 / transcript=Cvel_23744.t1 / gene=Cvel_23744 / organism=Chromera_velia_CCMP2878 / gene_product=Ultraviolet-B receptor UVR8, putative / transcript_product=Ultraviolet-B receptor UVR8, putative / location=Cvel_scaffold2486:211-14090(-) / protein_length=1162 / sequence_SO=supercontig / SO=protein_coding / is_pseudo=false